MTPAEFADITAACCDGRAWAVEHCATMDDAWRAIRGDWLVWIATRRGVLDDRTLRKFAVWSARQVQHLMTDTRSIAALDVAERHADGLATDEELNAARDDARDAARDAAWDAARAAARDDARDAAWDAARAAALDAARDAAWDAARAATWDATWDAARAAQAAWLRSNATPDWERARKMGGGK